VDPVTHYAKSGNASIAYQVIGEGPFDLVYVSGWISNIELMWEEPSHARFLNRLASFSRLLLIDKRGTGLSDRVAESELPTLEQRMDDVRAVMDAVGSARAALLGHSEGGNMAMLFAATYPQRTMALITFGVFAKRIWSADYPWAPTPEQRQRWYDQIEQGWGGVVDLSDLAPSVADDEGFLRWWATYLRRSASPSAALTLGKMNTQIDVRDVLPAIGVPTLVLHRTGDRDVQVEEARYIAGRIPGAKLVELPGVDHLPWVGDQDSVLDEIQEFLTGIRQGPAPDRVLVTVLFTDVVGATARAAKLGDRRWRDLLSSHYATVRHELYRYRGNEVQTIGDGFLATFDGPARAIRCACAIRDQAHDDGLSIRAGLHTGECELIGSGIGGIAVHIGARVAALARSDEVVVSSTVKDLVVGSGIAFEDRGQHALKGVPGSWRLFSVGGC
jgi:pimeloyl-ACP methyl ester carboxylesterase